MGKAPKLLTLLVADKDLFESAPIQKLVAQGHTVRLFDPEPYDGILGDRCRRLNVTLLPNLNTVIRGLRAKKYGVKEEGDGDSKVDAGGAPEQDAEGDEGRDQGGEAVC